MSATAAADPVRNQVEAALRQLVDGLAAVPCRMTRRARGAVTTSIGLARTMFELTLSSLVPGGAHRSDPAPGTRPTTLPARPRRADVTTGREAPVGGAAAETLPLEGYESLAASQVVARLARLSPAELHQIKKFELANRGRRTILGKIEQLLGS